MIRADLWNDTAGRLKPQGAFAWDMWRNDPRMNPSLQQATPDDEVLAYNQRQHELAQQLLMQENARKARANVALLERAAAQPNFNLFGAPTNPTEKQIQGIVQGDVNAGTLGWNLGLDAQERNRRQANEDFARRIQAQNAALNRAKYGQDIRESNRDFALKAMNDLERQKYQKQMLEISKLRAQGDKADSASRTAAANTKMAIDAVREYGMDPEEAIQVFGVPKEARGIIHSYGALAAQGDEGMQDYADLYSQMELAQMRRSPEALAQADDPNFLERWFQGKQKVDPNTFTREQLLALNPTFSEDALKSRADALKMGLRYDPKQGFFLPPRQMGPPASAAPQPAQVPQNVGGVPLQIVQVRSPQEARLLPKGTRFMVPDGRVMMR